MLSMKAEPYDFEFDPKKTALVMIDFQRDFVYPGGFGEALGNDTSPLLKALPPADACECVYSVEIGTPGSCLAVRNTIIDLTWLTLGAEVSRVVRNF